MSLVFFSKIGWKNISLQEKAIIILHFVVVANLTLIMLDFLGVFYIWVFIVKPHWNWMKKEKENANSNC